jgi:hypothetical protein
MSTNLNPCFGGDSYGNVVEFWRQSLTGGPNDSDIAAVAFPTPELAAKAHALIRECYEYEIARLRNEADV